MQFIPAAGISRNRRRAGENWFEQRRDFFVCQLFADFFAITRSFQEVYQSYRTCSTAGSGGCCDLLTMQNEGLRCTIWDQLTLMVGTEKEKGPLWHLKDLCHRIWPESEQSQNVEGSLIDWFIGSIFHEAMKLKEDVYLLNSYGPAAFKVSDPNVRLLQQEVPASRLAQIMDSKGLTRRIVVNVIKQMEQLAFLFGQANYMLRTMTPSLAQNMLLVRFLVEQEDTVQELWGEGVTALFEDMFFGAPEQGFCAAGRSYMNGQWYPQALSMYQRAVDIDRGCDEAVIKMYQLQAMIRQNSELLGVA